MPQLFVHAIWLHHQSFQILADLPFLHHRKIIWIVQLADHLVHQTMADTPIGWEAPGQRRRLVRALEIRETDLQQVAASLGKAYSQRAAILESNESEAAFYYQCLQRANRQRAAAPGDQRPQNRSKAADTAHFLLDLHRQLSQMDDLRAMLAYAAEAVRNGLGKPDGLILGIDRVGNRLTGCHWSDNGPVRAFTVRVDAKGLPLRQPDLAMSKKGFQLLMKTYKAAAVLSKTGTDETTINAGGPFQTLVLREKTVVGALSYSTQPPKQTDRGDTASGPCPVVDHLGHIVGSALASAMGREKLQSTADSLAAALAQNQQVVETLKKTCAEKHEMEQVILRAHRLESIGFLSGGIAHDFNNILTALTGSVSLAKIYLKPEDKAHEKLVQAEKAIQRARDLNAQLVGFSKGSTPDKKPICILDPLKDAVGFALSGANVQCVYDIAAPAVSIEADEGQINQVFHNLILNAVQAMPGGGTIRVTVADRLGENDRPRHLPPGDYVKVAICDRGPGIGPADLPRVFDPYFTTKRDGSGLGLSMAYTIIKNHGGDITAASKPGGGSVFSVYLPSSKAPSKKKRVVDRKIRSGSGKILVMDDEKELRDLTGEMLALMGYDVCFAGNGSEAIETYKKQMHSLQPFDAVIMDLTVPGGMGGKEAIGELKKIDPAVKAVVTSGYVEDPAMIDYKQHGFSGAIAKPYRMSDLSRLLSDIHHGQTGSASEQSQPIPR